MQYSSAKVEKNMRDSKLGGHNDDTLQCCHRATLPIDCFQQNNVRPNANTAFLVVCSIPYYLPMIAAQVRVGKRTNNSAPQIKNSDTNERRGPRQAIGYQTEILKSVAIRREWIWGK